MADVNNPHERFFCQTLATPQGARDFLHGYLPADVAALLNLAETPELMKDICSRSCRRSCRSWFIMARQRSGSRPGCTIDSRDCRKHFVPIHRTSATGFAICRLMMTQGCPRRHPRRRNARRTTPSLSAKIDRSRSSQPAPTFSNPPGARELCHGRLLHTKSSAVALYARMALTR
ncbi:MAG: Rpn family recombination-promoting nuclease/putative transposase [Caldilineaceae bacterium]|nr:Rpn family recombination-promoting nuclease/putative transposase [Caldilineaceae bacterium]